ncbi:hypothetical protein THAOC_12001, partial [Thalassiosira oceanica]
IELQLKEGLQVIGAHAFAFTALRSVTLPPSLTELGEKAFCGCGNLAEVLFNKGLQTIGLGVFHLCSALRSMTMPSTVTELGSYAFCHCSNLVELQLNEGLWIIGDCAFENCSALRSVTIPSTVTEFGANAFCGCINLSQVIFLGGKRLLNQEFVDCGFRQRREEQGLLYQEALDDMLFDETGISHFLVVR